MLSVLFSSASLSSDDVEFEVSSDRRTGKPIAVKLLKIKPEVLPEERISGQVGPDLHAYPFTVLHGYIHPVKEHHFIFGSLHVCQLNIYISIYKAHFAFGRGCEGLIKLYNVFKFLN